MCFTLEFYGISLINLSDASVICNINPIISCIMACIFLKEKIMVSDIINIIVSFIGILLIIRPKFIFKFIMMEMMDDGEYNNISNYN